MLHHYCPVEFFENAYKLLIERKMEATHTLNDFNRPAYYGEPIGGTRCCARACGLLCPNGAQYHSPGLRPCRYPGCYAVHTYNPTGVVSTAARHAVSSHTRFARNSTQPRWGRNHGCIDVPRVAARPQPWALLLCPVGASHGAPIEGTLGCDSQEASGHRCLALHNSTDFERRHCRENPCCKGDFSHGSHKPARTTM